MIPHMTNINKQKIMLWTIQFCNIYGLTYYS